MIKDCWMPRLLRGILCGCLAALWGCATSPEVADYEEFLSNRVERIRLELAQGYPPLDEEGVNRYVAAYSTGYRKLIQDGESRLSERHNAAMPGYSDPLRVAFERGQRDALSDLETSKASISSKRGISTIGPGTLGHRFTRDAVRSKAH